MLTLFRGSEDFDRESLIQEVAKEVAHAARANLKPTAANMNVAELRGYLRTRAAREAREQVHRSMAEVRLPQEFEPEVTAAVLERAVHLIIRDLLVSPIVSIPAPHVQTRAA
jgi:hypothetical protein